MAARISAFALALVCLSGVLGAQDEETASEQGASRPYRAKPIPAGAEAPTNAQHRSKRRIWFQDTLLSAYREHGHHSPKWDADVEQLIRDHVRYFFEYASLDVDEKQRISVSAMDLIGRGIKDPLVSYLASYYAFQCIRTQEARDLGGQAIELFKDATYPPMFKAWAFQNQRDILNYRNESVRGKPYIQPQMEARADAAGSAMYANGNQRFYAEDIGREWDFGKGVADDAPAFVQMLEERPASAPWIVPLLRGWMHIRLGWKARTGGTVDEVTEDGWEKFFEHMEAARLALRAAHAMHPEFPEAAASMVYVVMAHEDELSIREWFDRAVAAELDYRYVYRDYMWALMPRWGGTHQEILRLGQEALETKRYDTSVPDLYAYALYLISTDYEEESKLEVFRGPKVYERLREYCKGYGDADPKNATKFRSILVLYAWAAGRTKAAAAILHELGDQFIEEPTQYLKVHRDLMMRDLEPHLEELRRKDAAKKK